MRIAGLVLGILGGLAAGMLAVKWLSDASQFREHIELAKSVGIDTSEINRLVIGAYVLLGSLLLGIVGGVLALKGKGKPAAGLMIAGGVAPAFFAPVALVFTWLLLAGGVVSFWARPRQAV